MLFTSLDFFLFLPAVLAVFALLPARARTAWLLIASWAFYGWSQPRHLLWLAGVTALVFACGALLERVQAPRWRGAGLALGVTLLVGALGAFKYGAPDSTWAAPAGFSFYVFSGVSYLVDAWRRTLPLGANAGETALYLAWFPKVLAGPIERAPALLPQLRAALRPTPRQVVLGTQLLAWGLVKKVVIADNLAPLVDRTFGMVAYASPVELLAAVYLFSFQIYCDFSGYSDIAIGVSLLFGLELMENFRRPYLARSVGEFWSQRWHISLARWFRDYLYVPLGGSRAGTARTYLNVMLVFVASGVWHAGLGYGGLGATFLVWGALNGAYRWAGLASAPLWQRAAARLPRVAASGGWQLARIVFTFHLIALGWVFFRAKSVQDGWLLLRRIGAAAADLPELALRYPWTSAHATALALVVLLLAVEWIDERRPLFERLRVAPAWLRWSAGYAAIAMLLVLGRWQAREFIYMQF
ncbi:MBOAT family O-acyltransferase [Ramlibacter sp. AN1133]|uniref:MBOAT family O-acyltransferase n=1 Tax=Ramlibacter sp. AN1133 TaxID=3133429 RepID=UPI0030BD5BAB